MVLPLLFLVLIRILVGSAMEWRRAEDKLSAGELRNATLHYGRTIRWYFPGNPYVRRAANKLLHLSQESWQQQDYRLALHVNRVLSGSLSATRSFYQPYAEMLQQGRENIAKLTPLVESERNIDPQQVLAKLEEDRDPDLWWSFVSSLAFLAWIGLVVGFIYSGFSESGQFIGGRKASLCGFGALTSLILWLFGLWLA